MRSLFDNLIPASERPLIEPRDYQAAAIDGAYRLWDEHHGVLVRAFTGAGKTIIAGLIAERWLAQGGNYRVLVLCHERQLVTQFCDELEELLGERPGVEMGNCHVYPEDMPRVVIASRASLYEKPTLDEATGETTPASRLYKFQNMNFNWLVVVDEAHRYKRSLKSCQHIFEWFEQNPLSRRLGQTATPERGDKVSLEYLFPGIALDYRQYDADGGSCAVDDGWCVPYDQRFVTVEGVDFKNLREVGGDFDRDELAEVLSERETIMRLVQPTIELVGERSTLIFSPTVAMANLVALTLNAECKGGVAKCLHGSVPDLDRREVYAEHQRGDFQFLSVCGLCREGYNDPGIQAIAVYRPTKSRPLAEQMKGRGCRPLRGLVDGLETPEERVAAIAQSDKPNCMIVDLVGMTGLGDVATTAHIFGQGKPDEVIERANKLALDQDGGVDMAECVREAQTQIDAEERKRLTEERLERERREQEQADHRARVGVDVQYNAHQVEQGHGYKTANRKRGARMLFGRHKGELLTDVPLDYLESSLRGYPEIRVPWLKAAIQREVDRRKKSSVVMPTVTPIDDVNRMLMESW